MVTGRPLVGNLPEYLRDPVGLLRRGHERHGRVFSLRLGFRRMAVLLGAENNRFFFGQPDDVLAMDEAHRWVVPMFGDRFPLAASADVHQAHRPVYASPFHPRRMDGYVATMAREASAWVDALGDGGELEIVNPLRRLTFDAAVRVILGDEVRQAASGEMWREYARLTRGTGKHVVRNLTFPSPTRSLARRRLRARASRVVEAVEAGRGDGFVGALLETAGVDGDRVPRHVVVDLALGMVWAMYPTTSAHLAWTLVLLLQHRRVLEDVMAELEGAATGPGPLDAGGLGRLVVLERVLKEAERLRPAVLVLGRRNRRGYEREGYFVPAGWTTIVSPAVSHRLPEEFPDPDRFDPDRFAPGREGAGRAADLVGFGGGVHACVGKPLAKLWIKTVLSILLPRYRLDLLPPVPAAAPGPNPNHPRAPVRVRYEGRSR